MKTKRIANFDPLFPIGSQVLDILSAAELLGMPPKAVRKRVERRMIPFRKWGGRICFVRVELESFIAALPGCTLEEAQNNEEAKRG